ncbi:MAG: carotenoid biosynthesis protein [Fimbriimonadaceae bacterium]|nr:carotenoid biosynthesis protein [Fimbriimonadaceae bacterium]
MRFSWHAAFVFVTVVAVAGAIVARHTGVRPPYWLGSAVGFAAILAGATWIFVLLSARLPARSAPLRAIGVCFVTTVLELCSLAYGAPFGRYRYTELWQPGFQASEAIGWFPIALPLAWFILSGACALLVRSRVSGRWFLVATGLAFAVVDAVLEPVMIGPVGFWRWDTAGPLLGAPWSNFLGWLVTGTVVAVILEPLRPDPRGTREATLLLVTVLVGSVVVGVGHGTYDAAWGLVPLALLLTLLATGRHSDPDRTGASGA